MPTDLHQQLADELGVSPTEAERVLDELIEGLKSRTETGDEVTIRNLGAFYLEDDQLCFTPSPPLQKAVNYRNDHLAPLTVGEAPEEPPPVPEPASDAEASPVDEPQPADISPSDEGEDVMPAQEPVADAPASGTEEIPDLSDEWTSNLDDTAQAAAAAARRRAGRRTRRRADSGPSSFQILGLVASVVVLVLLVWFVLDTQGVLDNTGTLSGARSESSPAVTDTAATTTADSVTAMAPATASADEQHTNDPLAPPPTIDRATGGWTIVVASRTRPAAAETVLTRYQQRFLGEDIPVDIVTGSSGGQIRYRIAVGQYPSVATATQGLEQLGSRVPEDAWVTRVLPNS